VSEKTTERKNENVAGVCGLDVNVSSSQIERIDK